MKGMKLMSTSDLDTKLSSESEKLKHEILVGESIVQSARNKYAEELGGSEVVSQMRKLASVHPKTYPIPKRVRKIKRPNVFLHKIKVLLGFESQLPLNKFSGLRGS